MAGKEFPLSIILKAVDDATAEIRKTHGRITKMGAGIASVGKKMTAGLTLPIVGIGAASIAAFSEFQTGMSNVSTLIDTSKENLDAMSQEVLKLGARTPVALSDLTGALYDARSAGVSAADQFRVLEGSARLSVAGLGTTKEAMDLVTSSMNAFQLKGEDAEKVYDTIFKTVKFGKTTIAGLAQGFGAVAGTVAASGTAFDEYLASVAALTTTGLPAAAAHTQLKAVIAGLAKDTKETSKVFKRLGAKDFKDLIAKSGGLVPALDKVKAVLKGDESAILKLVGSTEAWNAVLGLTGAQAEAFTTTLRGMRDGTDAVNEAYLKQAGTTANQWKTTKNTLLSAGITIGTILAPALEKLAALLQRAVNWFNSLDKGTQDWIVTAAGIVAVVGPALLVLGKMVTAFMAIKSAVGGAKAAMVAFKAAQVASAAAGAAGTAGAAGGAAGIGALGAGALGVGAASVGTLAAVGLGGLVGGVGVGMLLDNWLGLSDKISDAAAGTGNSQHTDTEGMSDIDRQIAEAEARARGYAGDPATAKQFTDLVATLQKQKEAQAKIMIDFANAPPGMRASAAPGATADVDMNVGYQLGMP